MLPAASGITAGIKNSGTEYQKKKRRRVKSL
jgi:hypothetical protein